MRQYVRFDLLLFFLIYLQLRLIIDGHFFSCLCAQNAVNDAIFNGFLANESEILGIFGAACSSGK